MGDSTPNAKRGRYVVEYFGEPDCLASEKEDMDVDNRDAYSGDTSCVARL